MEYKPIPIWATFQSFECFFLSLSLSMFIVFFTHDPLSIQTQCFDVLISVYFSYARSSSIVRRCSKLEKTWSACLLRFNRCFLSNRLFQWMFNREINFGMKNKQKFTKIPKTGRFKTSQFASRNTDVLIHKLFLLIVVCKLYAGCEWKTLCVENSHTQ